MAHTYSIGALARRTGIKVPTIRYYESVGLLAPPERTRGNQRRYDETARERLDFIAHGRALGFSMDAIRALLEIAAHPDRACTDMDALVRERLADVQTRIARLTRLRDELTRLTHTGEGMVRDCRVLAALSDHSHCAPGHLQHERKPVPPLADLQYNRA